jgi:UDP-3-O-[3-hydroxymyristoyl] N-acetylglucosamine deacetylase
MKQRTIKKEVQVVGIGLHSGSPVTMRLKPAEDDYGIVFVRSDMGVSIPLQPKYVVDTKMATVLGKGDVQISTIEHLLSAISAFGLDNLIVEVNADEIPIMDGSSASFCMLFQETGVITQKKNKKILMLKKPIEIRDGEKFVRLVPSKKNELDFEIKFDHPVIKNQKYEFVFTKSNYLKEIARARTFGFLKEVQYLRSIGKARGGSLDNAVVLDEKRVLNTEGLRFKDEFVRHKILDAIGDMMLLGMPFFARYESFAGSHHLNFQLTKAVLEDKDAYEVVEIGTVAESVMEKAFA